MLTARSTVEDRIEELKLEADDYLTKTVNWVEAQAHHLIEGRKRLYERFNSAWGSTALPSAGPALSSF